MKWIIKVDNSIRLRIGFVCLLGKVTNIEMVVVVIYGKYYTIYSSKRSYMFERSIHLLEIIKKGRIVFIIALKIKKTDLNILRQNYGSKLPPANVSPLFRRLPGYF